MKLLMMGPPASGKGTAGKLLSEATGIPIFSAGKLLREIPKESILYEPLHEKMDKGELAPDGLTAGGIREELKDEKYKDGFILDGWMRDLDQQKFFDPEVDFVIFIDISEETSVKRISGRRFCPKDDFSCNIYTLPPKNPNLCDKCGGELIQREDDSEESVEKRLEIYKNDTVPVIEKYKKEGKVIEVDGEVAPEEVLKQILAKLKDRDSN